MKNYTFILFLLTLLIMGCSSSDVATNKQTSITSEELTTVEMLKKELSALKVENQSLKEQIAKLEQVSRSAVAKAAELEIQLNELREQHIQIPPTPQAPKVYNDINERYENGLKAYREKKYKIAYGIFKQLIEEGPPDDMEDNCYYWLGECSYALKEFKEAINHFMKVFHFQQSEKRDDAQLMIANCYLAMGNKNKAKSEYEKLISNYPRSPYIKFAAAKLKHL